MEPVQHPNFPASGEAAPGKRTKAILRHNEKVLAEHVADMAKLQARAPHLAQVWARRTAEPLASDRYLALSVLGKGTWSIVYKAKDLSTGRLVAVKTLALTETSEAQCLARNIEHDQVLLRDAVRTDCARYILPRRLETDLRGSPIIIMPVVRLFLSDVFYEDSEYDLEVRTSRRHLDHVVRHAYDIIRGVEEVHRLYDRAYCDLKPDNIGVYQERLVICDMGTSTASSTWQHSGPRDFVGFPYTREPGLFCPGSVPHKASDTYAIGSILQRLAGGMYAIEWAIDNVMQEERFKDPEKICPYLQSSLDEMLEGWDCNHGLAFEENPALSRLVQRCLSGAYQDATALREDFERCVMPSR